MSWMVFLTGVLTLSMLLPVMLRQLLARLPEAPACPVCRTLTERACAGHFADRFLPLSWTTTVQACAECGWRGLMRWRWAQRTVPRDR